MNTFYNKRLSKESKSVGVRLLQVPSRICRSLTPTIVEFLVAPAALVLIPIVLFSSNA